MVIRIGKRSTTSPNVKQWKTVQCLEREKGLNHTKDVHHRTLVSPRKQWSVTSPKNFIHQTIYNFSSSFTCFNAFLLIMIFASRKSVIPALGVWKSGANKSRWSAFLQVLSSKVENCQVFMQLCSGTLTVVLQHTIGSVSTNIYRWYSVTDPGVECGTAWYWPLNLF